MSSRRAPLGAYAARSPAGLAMSQLWQGVERKLANPLKSR
jgi:hypothetical protein